MNLIKYEENYLKEMAELFYITVHTVNAKDYNKHQLNAWGKKDIDLKSWNTRYLNSYTILAVEQGKLIGFSNIKNNGYVDMMYVHKDFQNKGVATAMLKELENYANKNKIKNFSTHASITAKPFFEKMGYKTLKENIVIIGEVSLINYIMEKDMQD